MKVLMLGWDFRSERTGGVGTACHGLAHGLIQVGAEVTVLAPSVAASADLATVPLASSIPSPHPSLGPRSPSIPSRGRRTARGAVAGPGERSLRLLHVHSPLTPYQSRATYGAAPARPFSPDLLDEVARFARAVGRATEALEFDVVHAHDWMTLPAALRVADRSGKPLVFHVHTTEFDRSPGRPDPALVAVEQHGLAHADRVVAVSHRTAERLRSHYRVDAAKLSVVHNALLATHEAPRATGRANARPLVLFLGRLTHQKDPHTFLRAAALVAPGCPAAKFVVAGDGELLGELRTFAGDLGLADRVHFTGALAGEDVDRMYRLADVYVMPSVAEPFGISALEAMAADVPVLVSRTSGALEVVQNAIPVEPGDHRALADELIALLEQPGLRRELGARGGEEARSQRWEVRARSLLRLFEELAA